MGQSFFHFKSFSILQKAGGLKVTTDACVLGAIATHPSPLSCLDIGSGTGVLSLMLATRFPNAFIKTIELEEKIAAQAFENIGNSVYNDRIQLIQGDFTKQHFGEKFDLVLCNPPYFKDHLVGTQKEKNTAMHNTSLPMDALASITSGLLNPGASFWVIYPEREMEKFKGLALQNSLYCNREIHVFNKPGRHFRTICCFSKEVDEHAIEEMTLHNSEGERTKAFSQLMHDFYLENTQNYKRS